MARTRVFRLAFLAFFLAAALPHAIPAQQVAFTTEKRKPLPEPVRSVPMDALWHDPGEISVLDLAFGAGGKEHAPRADAKYSFVKEDLGGTSPKFYVKDDEGVEWLVKVGDEARGETAATRFVWAMGYFTDEDYFVPELHVTGLGKLHRHSKSVHHDGTITNARLKRSQEDQKKIANWAWADNPFHGSRELNGLRVIMALINNWDLKTVNNKVYGRKKEVAGSETEPSASTDDSKKLGDGSDAMAEGPAATGATRMEQDNVRYVVSDLGASFGRTGAFFSRSKGRAQDYAKDKFIRSTTPETVDFVMRTKPGGIIRLFKPGYSRKRMAMAATAHNIPRDDARWIGAQLAKLTPEQVRSAFASSGFTAREVDTYCEVLNKRIAELNAL